MGRNQTLGKALVDFYDTARSIEQAETRDIP